MTGYTYQPVEGASTECLFVKNLQGDVESVISATGNLLASYTYDAWGSICQSSGSLADINPIRYRSFYFHYDAAGGYAGYKIAESNGYTGWKKAGAIAAGAVVGGAVGVVVGYVVSSFCGSRAIVDSTITISLSNGDIKHILNNHSVHRFAQQMVRNPAFQSGEALISKGFFNPQWSEKQIIEAVEYAYGDALKSNITNGLYSTYYLGEKITIAFTNGTMSTCYGSHYYTVEELIRIAGGS